MNLNAGNEWIEINELQQNQLKWMNWIERIDMKKLKWKNGNEGS